MFKVFKDGQLPTRGSKLSACVDLYAREDVTEKEINNGKDNNRV